MVTINANPMCLVQGQYTIEYTRGIGFPLVVTVLSPTKTQTQPSKFCLLDRFLVRHDHWICTKGYAHAQFVGFWTTPKTGTRLICPCIPNSIDKIHDTSIAAPHSYYFTTRTSNSYNKDRDIKNIAGAFRF